jgi:uncharacterized membrane protein
LLLSFAAACAATALGCCVGWKYVAGKQLVEALGRDGLIIASALMAKNIGGGINYIAVCRSLGASPQAIAAGLCIDNIFALVYFPATTAIGSNRPDVEDQSGNDSKGNTGRSSKDVENTSVIDDHPITVQTISSSLCVSAILLWLGERIGGSTGALPITTLLTVVLASQLGKNSTWFRSIQTASNTVGTTCLYLFFSTAGAIGLSVADSVKSSLIPLTLFLTSLYSIHGLVLWLCYKVWGRRGHHGGAFVPQRLLVASSSAIGGPATSVALAKSSDWKSLEVPSLLVGNIGYAVATFCGLAFFKLFST